MTKRYYYDCPIEAAYMAKNFGMKFCSSNDVHSEDDDPLDFLDDFLGETFDYRRYIAPESLALLEPKEADIILYDCAGSHEPFIWEERIMRKEHVFKTIQRDGKPFIWPKEGREDD